MVYKITISYTRKKYT